MASRLNTLLHGEAVAVADALSKKAQPNQTALVLDLRAALTNALRRIAALEDRIDSESSRIEMQVEKLSERTEKWLNSIEDRIESALL